MLHGAQQFYLERARFERRLSLITVTVSTALLGVLWLAGLPEVRRRVPINAVRFGFEGRDNYVRRIILESAGPLNTAAGRAVTLVQQSSSRGGTRERGRSRSPQAVPVTSIHRIGPGESSEALLARARSIYRSAPVIQSEDLVIEQLVKPLYPEDARDRNIEGRVALVALVDTTGRVANVDVMDSTGERQLERAAAEAVWQCRFRPYRVGGEVHEVYAVFRFAFRIY
jgi:TonB family protein